MKQRLISAAIGLAVLAIVLFFYQTVLLNIAISIVGALSVFEIFRSTKALGEWEIAVSSIAYSLIFPFSQLPEKPNFCGLLTVCYVLFLFIALLYRYEKISVNRIAFLGMTTLALSYSFWTIIAIRDKFAPYSIYYIMLVFALSWICDAGAYFTGRAFGKHKLAPKISPNKTIEGAVGGLAVNFIFAALLTVIFAVFIYTDAKISIVGWSIITLLGSFLGIIGDLCASSIKRQLKIKDFGNLLPGHGGAIDRFDSLLFVSVIVYVVGSFLPIFI